MAGKYAKPLFLGLLFLGIGGLLMVGSVLIHRNDTAFFAAATQTKAMIVDKQVISRANKRDHMSLRYAFDVSGQVVEGFERWSGSTADFRALSEGDSIDIAYMANEDPERIKSRLITGGRQDFMTSMLVIGGVFFAVGGLVTSRSLRNG